LSRSEPPAESRPEANNFPTAQYEFNESRKLFHAPRAYPEPPKDMWYQVPETKPTPTVPPKPIFPWEKERRQPKATRVFAEDLPPEPTPAPAIAAPAPIHAFSTMHYSGNSGEWSGEEAKGVTGPPRVSSPQTSDEQWQTFQQNSTNAWDTVPGIDTYVRAIIDAQARRGKPQIIQPFGEPDAVRLPGAGRKGRRESLIITDFPSAVDRPSLPVTPAPIRRPTFWGEEKVPDSVLPKAEGVPDQTEWVCPQCGFSSVRAEHFYPARHPSSIASTPIAFAAPPIPPSATSVQISSTHEASAPVEVDLSEARPLDMSPGSTPTYRPGLSPSGVPLASLTDPFLLSHPSQAPDISGQASSAFEKPEPLATATAI
jgi:glycogenin glucosyltransferase